MAAGTHQPDNVSMAQNQQSRRILISIGAVVGALVGLAVFLAVQPPQQLDPDTPEGEPVWSFHFACP